MSQLIGYERSRIRSIDLLRGTVMIIMALDHVRDFFHSQAMISDPLDLQTTTPVLFFTRWITHFCAPVFVFLSGVSAYLSGRKKSKAALGLFLVKRGAWLVCAEILIISLALTFDPFYHVVFLEVIWAIGISMVILGLLVRLPFAILALIGLVILFGHNLLDYPMFFPAKPNFWWLLVHGFPSVIPISKTYSLFVSYSFLPWTGIMICGYCFGRLFEFESKQRVRACLFTGIALIVIFIIFRSINMYGNPTPWAVQRTHLFTFLSFINVTKYPPSLTYICLTLGPAIILLALVEKTQNKFSNLANLFGRVPFFYFVIHLFLIHALCAAAFFLSGYTAKEIAVAPSPFLFRPPAFGYPLVAVYALWLTVIIIMYPACGWYNRYKKTHTHWWLNYL